MFNLCDIRRQVEKVLKDAEIDIIGNMNEDNKKGYDFGVKTMLSILEQVIGVGEDEDSILVNKTGLSKDVDYEECDLHDLLEKFDGRIVVNRN
jgi:hypothetical protein